MGDFVDRGNYSVETFLLLLALKVKKTSIYKDLAIGQIPRENNFDQRQSRIKIDHIGLWLL